MESRLQAIERLLCRDPTVRNGLVDHDSGFQSQIEAPQALSQDPANSQQNSSVTLTQNSYEVTVNLSCSLGAFPASSLESFDTKEADATTLSDLITRGNISEEAAGSLVAFFLNNVSPYVPSVLAKNESLESLRSRSSLLTSAVCTTAAICSGSDDYLVCRDALMADTTSRMFGVQYNFDEVRAMCIASLWLPENSATFNALGEFYVCLLAVVR